MSFTSVGLNDISKQILRRFIGKLQLSNIVSPNDMLIQNCISDRYTSIIQLDHPLWNINIHYVGVELIQYGANIALRLNTPFMTSVKYLIGTPVDHNKLYMPHIVLSQFN